MFGGRQNRVGAGGSVDGYDPWHCRCTLTDRSHGGDVGQCPQSGLDPLPLSELGHPAVEFDFLCGECRGLSIAECQREWSGEIVVGHLEAIDRLRRGRAHCER